MSVIVDDRDEKLYVPGFCQRRVPTDCDTLICILW